MGHSTTARNEGGSLRLAAVLLLAIGSISSLGCTRAEDPERPPSLLLISIDTARADHFAAYGYPRDTSPNLVALAAEGARFEQAYAPTATTAPSHATLLTALDPIGHHVFKNGVVLSSKHVTLAQILEKHGYRTGAFVSSYVLAPRFGLNRGFADYEAPGASSRALQPRSARAKAPTLYRIANETTERALVWLEAAAGGGQPFFLFLHYFDPHHPYWPPEPFRGRYLDELPSERRTRDEAFVELYDAELAFIDHQLGLLIDALEAHGIANDTVVVFTADHGEGLGEHGWKGHGLFLYEEAVRVPLVMRWPERIGPGLVFEEPVGIVDLVPSLLDLMGVDLGAMHFHGLSLAPALLGRSGLDPERPIFLQRRRYESKEVGAHPVQGDQFAVRVGRWKYIEALDESSRELYDLDADPAELEDIVERHPEQAAALAARLREWKTRHGLATAEPTPVSPDDQKRLEALGYVE
jgi:arylsulfatase A-like enzyme